MSKGIAENLHPGTAIEKHRRWRGLKDTAYDYGQWCRLWGILLKWALAHPAQNVKAVFRYRWMFSYLTVPSFFDRLCAGQRGAGLRAARNNLNYLASDVTETLTTIFSADLHLHPGSKKAEALNKQIICVDELLPALIGKGFPNCKTILLQEYPMYLPSLINQHSPVHYIGQTELHGLPADVCPLPLLKRAWPLRTTFPRLAAVCSPATCPATAAS